MRDIEQLMQILEENDGEVDLWVCDFHKDRILEKAHRNVKPTKVKVRYNPIYLSKKPESRKYLSAKDKVELVAYKKDGKTLSKRKIPLTSTVSYDKGVYYFYNEEECNEQYNKLIFEAIKKFEEQKVEVIKRMDKEIEDLKKSFANSDFVMETLYRSK